MHAFRFHSRQAAAGMDLLPPDRAPRTTPKTSPARPAAFVDAEFEVVPRAARGAPYPVFNDNSRDRPRPSGVRAPQMADVVPLPLRVLGRIEAMLQRVSVKTYAMMVAGVSATVFLLLVGLPGGAAPVPSAPLVLSTLKTVVSEENGMKVLSVYGTVQNRSNAAMHVPTIVVDVIASGKRVTASRVAAGASSLDVGENRAFSTRLLHTGGKLPEVAVSFEQADAPAR